MDTLYVPCRCNFSTNCLLEVNLAVKLLLIVKDFKRSVVHL